MTYSAVGHVFNVNASKIYVKSILNNLHKHKIRFPIGQLAKMS